jgi:metal-responsive CopG/Arc/MetJ family transcriptional regulator
MHTLRMNITLPEILVKELREITTPRKQSQFISNAIEKQIKYYKKKQLELSLIEGYKEVKDENIELSKDFENQDIEGWDEY